MRTSEIKGKLGRFKGDLSQHILIKFSIFGIFSILSGLNREPLPTNNLISASSIPSKGCLSANTCHVVMEKLNTSLFVENSNPGYVSGATYAVVALRMGVLTFFSERFFPEEMSESLIQESESKNSSMTKIFAGLRSRRTMLLS